jgi:hypothetical protein
VRPAVGLALALGVAAGCVPETTGGVHIPAWVGDTSSYGTAPSTEGPSSDRFHEVAAKILATAHADRGAYAKLTQLTDTIGNRISGSPALDRAIAWAKQTLEADGHTARTEPVMVPRSSRLRRPSRSRARSTSSGSAARSRRRRAGSSPGSS